MPWGSTHCELWIKAQIFGNSKPKIPQEKPPRFASLGIPKGFCHKFQKGVECHGCKYKHTCYKCNLSHIRLIAVIFDPHRLPVLKAPLPGPEIPTPVQIQRLLPLLHGYDVELVHALYNGFKFGFPIHFQGPRVSLYAKNLASAYEHPQIVSAKIFKELGANRLAGPFDSPPFSTFRVSPLGLIPKKTPGEFRMIHHLSFPDGSSINDSIPSEFTSMNYARVDDAIALIKRLGPGCFLAKMDIQNAFRIIPIRPADYDLLGMSWEGTFYYDKAMPMGCSSSCRTFEIFSSAFEWIQNHLNIPHLIHILDDFLMGAPTLVQCRINLEKFLHLCGNLGVPIAHEKTAGRSVSSLSLVLNLTQYGWRSVCPRTKLSSAKPSFHHFLHGKKCN